MKSLFFKNKNFTHKYFLLDASQYILGHLAVKVCNILLGKNITLYNSNIIPKNYVIIINSNLVKVSENKEYTKFYYYPTQRPGNLKKKNFNNLCQKFSYKILESAILKMLPNNKLKKKYLQNLYIYNTATQILFKKQNLNSLNIYKINN